MLSRLSTHRSPAGSRGARALSALGSGVLGMSLLAGCGGKGGNAAAAAGGMPPTPITPAVVTRGTIEETETLDGQVTPFLQANIATQVSGTILRVYASQGDHVDAGETLAKIDDSPLQAQLEQQQGSQSQAEAKLQQARIQAPITAQSTQSALDTAMLNLAQARKQLLSDQALVDQNAATYQANRQLLSNGYVAPTVYAQSRASYISSRQTLSIDENRVSSAQAAVNEAKRNRLNVNLQSQVVAENRGAVDQADGTAKVLRTQIGQTVLKAPFSGTITQRMLDPGAYAGPNQPVYAIADTSRVYITFNVKDADLGYVKPGTSVEFTTSAFPKKVFRGKVDVVNPVPAQGTLLYPARLTMTNEGNLLRGGMLVHVKIVKSRATNALIVPSTAVNATPQGAEVYLVAGSGRDTTAKRVDVTPGVTDGSRTQIIGGGVEPGMNVVAVIKESLRDGAPVMLPQSGPPQK